MTNIDIAKVQHYVPRFVLRRFVERKEQIWVFDKKRRKKFRTNIKNVAAESGFYDIEVSDVKLSLEPSLGQVESDISKIFKKIIQQESIAVTKAERVALSHFFSLQFVRTPQWRHMWDGMQQQMEEFLVKNGLDPNQVEGFEPSNPRTTKLNHLNQVQRSEEYAPHFFNKTWVLLKTTKSNPFWISDNPVSLQNMRDHGFMGNIGLAVGGIEIYFPIARHLSIGMWCKSHEDEFSEAYEKYTTMKAIAPAIVMEHFTDPEYIEEVNLGLTAGTPIRSKPESVLNHNSLQVKYSSRFIYSSNPDFSLVEEMLDVNPEFAEGPKLRVN